MHVIKTLYNLRQLHHDNAISDEVFNHIHEKIEKLHEALEPDLDIENFSLNKHGSIGLLEETDTDLSTIGLPSSFDEIMPEWVGRLEIADENYHILYVLADNDYCLQVYLPDKIINETIRQWLSEQILEDEKEVSYDLSTHAF